jgi:hypothetical protein
MYCSKCGSELPDNALFCLSCGAKTNENQPQSKVKKGFIIGALVLAILSLFIILGIPYSYIRMSSSLGGYIFIIVFNILLIVSILCLNKIKKWMVVPIVGFLLYDLLFLHSNLAKIYFTRGPQFFVHPTIKGIIVFLILISLCFLTLFGNGYVKKIAGVLSALIFIAVAYWLFRSMLLYEDEVLHSVHRAYGGNINFTHVFRFIFDFNDFRHIIKAYKLIYCRSLYYLACAVISLGVSFSEKIVKQPKKVQYVPAQETSSSQESEQPAPAPATDAYHPMPGDAKSTGLAILCFFFPMIGLILWLVWKDQYPLKASSCSKGAIIGVIVYVLLIIAIYALEFILIYNIWH